MINGDYHIHSSYSDGHAEPVEYVTKALQMGYKYLGFTEHSPLPFDNGFSLAEGRVDEYVRTIRALQKQYKDRITLFAGMEMDFIPGVSRNFIMKKERWGLDYLIGSVHLVLNEEKEALWFIDGPDPVTYDSGLNYLFDKDIRKAVGAYWHQVRKMINTESFPVVGHLDKIKMHNRNRFFAEDEDWYRKHVLDTLEEIRRKRLIVEVNTRGLYKKRSDSLFPGLWILQECNQRGIRIMLTSDAHKPEEIGLQMNESRYVLKDIGFKERTIITREGFREVPV